MFTSTGREVEVLLLAQNMSADDDPDGTYFEATYEFVMGPYACKGSRDRIPASGSASLSMEEVSSRGVGGGQCAEQFYATLEITISTLPP